MRRNFLSGIMANVLTMALSSAETVAQATKSDAGMNGFTNARLIHHRRTKIIHKVRPEVQAAWDAKTALDKAIPPTPSRQVKRNAKRLQNRHNCSVIRHEAKKHGKKGGSAAVRFAA